MTTLMISFSAGLETCWRRLVTGSPSVTSCDGCLSHKNTRERSYILREHIPRETKMASANLDDMGHNRCLRYTICNVDNLLYEDIHGNLEKGRAKQ